MKKLIIAPHADDEVLGCYSMLDKDTFVYFCGINNAHGVPKEKRLEEIKKSAEFLGFRWNCNSKSKVHYYDERDFINIFEDLINEHKPELILIPFPCYNQDHREVYKAAQIALRPHDENWFVKKVLVYEEPHNVIWEQKEFKVNYFVPIDIERKIKAFKSHESQVRDMRSPELIAAIAKIRGKQANYEFAEAFKIERWTE